MTKRFCIFLLVVLISATSFASVRWEDGKFSMFIHFGLYSELGGMWDGRMVLDGYSEQIQSFADIPDKQYGEVATRFNPVNFNADSIVDLAIQAGMRSVVVTAKHHDGFSIYDTQYSDFNIVDATPFKRDVLREISDACARRGISFGIYFSLVDWNFPHAVPKTSHNADMPTPKHHEFNVNQVRELLTNYGKVSELWFDMGSLSVEQSNELYALVKKLQPGCMVSSRLGNETGDFAVMADNRLPEYSIGLPWQTAASMYYETWGYRSWQELDSVDVKVNEKIATLVKVVSHGGNYLLNIGPRDDGSVTEHEQAVLRGVGEFVARYPDAIYATKANPYRKSFEWGEATVKDSVMYLFIMQYPEDGILRLRRLKSELRTARPYDDSMCLDYIYVADGVDITLPQPAKFDHGYYVMKLTFDSPVELLPDLVEGDLTPDNSEKTYGVSSLDYYASRRSLVRYEWAFRADKTEPVICYPAIYEGDTLMFDGGDGRQPVVLAGEPCDKMAVVGAGSNVMVRERYSAPFGSLAGPFRSWVFDISRRTASRTAATFDFKEKSSVLYTAKYHAADSVELRLMRISAADGVSVMLNGEVIYSQVGVQRKDKPYFYVLMPFKWGSNKVKILWHKRTPGSALCEASLVPEGMAFRKMALPPLMPDKDGICRLRLSNIESLPVNTDLDFQWFVVRY